MNSPKPDQIKLLRKTLGMKQKEAAEFVHVTTRAWQLWEAGDREMQPATWELYVIKCGMHPLYTAARPELSSFPLD